MSSRGSSVCVAPNVSPHWGYSKYGCRCERCTAGEKAYKRAWREQNSAAVEKEREASRRWKREHLGQPGKPKGVTA